MKNALSSQNNGGRLAIYLLLVASYFLACLLRSSSSVVLPKIAPVVGMTSGAIGLVSSMYFYGYMIAQPYSGTLCDRRGALLSCGLGLLLFACGVFIFARSTSSVSLGVGRFLTGLGAGPTFCGVLVYQAHAFAPDRYPLLTGITISLGHFGGVVAISPVGWLLDRWGHGAVHLVIAGIALCIGLVFIAFRGRDPIPLDWSPDSDSPNHSVCKGFTMIMRSSKLTRITAIWSMVMVLQLTLIGLWGVSWLVDSGCLPMQEARFCMSMAGMGVLAGALLGGLKGRAWTERTGPIKNLALLLAALLLLFVGSIYTSQHHYVILFLSTSAGALIGCMNVLSNASVHRIVDSSLIGTAIGAVNTILFLAVLIAQWSSGVLLDALRSKGIFGEGYAVVFLIVFLLMLLASIYLRGMKSFEKEAS